MEIHNIYGNKFMSEGCVHECCGKFKRCTDVRDEERQGGSLQQWNTLSNK